MAANPITTQDTVDVHVAGTRNESGCSSPGRSRRNPYPKKCMAKFQNAIGTPYVLHTVDYKQEDGITYLPLYMTPLV